MLTLNPLTGIMTTQRWAVLGAGSLDLVFLGSAILITLVILALGYMYFKRHERQMADVI
jgi:ABC-type polysaccharide/polyol phosphate export permease